MRPHTEVLMYLQTGTFSLVCCDAYAETYAYGNEADAEMPIHMSVACLLF